MFTSNPANERIVALLVIRLGDVPIGGIVSYDELKTLTGIDVLRRRDLLSRARTRAEREFRCIFEPARGWGIRRLPAEEAVDIGLVAIRGIRRKARKGAERTSRQDSNSLPRNLAQRQNAYSCHLGAIAMIADGNKSRTIAAVIDPVQPIPPADILKMFAK